MRVEVAVLFSFGIAGCAIADRPEIPAFRALPPDDGLLHAPASASPEDRTVQIRTVDAECSGALIAPDLVLTARHCVVSDAGNIDAPSAVRIEIGNVDSPWGMTVARDVELADCGSDAALIVMKRSVVGLAPFVVRSAPPTYDEELEAFGHGRCDDGRGLAPLRLRHGPLRNVEGQTLVVGFESCPGDSGGPVTIEGTNEIVGVVYASQDVTSRWPALGAGRTAAVWIDDPAVMFSSSRSATTDHDAACDLRVAKLPKKRPLPFGSLDCFDGWCESE